MDGPYYVNAAGLSHHQDVITAQLHSARRLQDSFHEIKRLSADAIVADREVLYRFRRLSEELDDLTRYYADLNLAMDVINEDANAISEKVGLLLDEHLACMSKLHSAV